MIQLIVVLLFLSFFQATIWPAELVLLVLIARSFVIDSRSNYWLAFGTGLLLSVLLHQPLGVLSLFFVLAIKFVHILRTIQFANSWIVISLTAFLILTAMQLGNMLFFKTGFSLLFVVWQALLILPIYLLTGFWEDRFIPRKDVKLKVSGR